MGRKLGESKSEYISSHPTHKVAFNAYIVSDKCYVWSGDLDLTIDLPILNSISQELDVVMDIQDEQGSTLLTINPNILK